MRELKVRKREERDWSFYGSGRVVFVWEVRWGMSKESPGKRGTESGVKKVRHSMGKRKRIQKFKRESPVTEKLNFPNVSGKTEMVF